MASYEVTFNCIVTTDDGVRSEDLEHFAKAFTSYPAHIKTSDNKVIKIAVVNMSPLIPIAEN